MRFRFNIRINGELHDIEQGFSTSREFEEALDGGKIKIVLSDLELPIEQYSFVEIVIYEVDYNEVILDTKREEYLVISDEVVLNSKYGYYEHNLTLLEFTAKLDLYQKSAFQFSKDIFENRNAKYEYILSYNQDPESFGNGSSYEYQTSFSYSIDYQIGFDLKGIKIPSVIFGGYVLKRVSKGKYAKMFSGPQPDGRQHRFIDGDVYVRIEQNGLEIFYGLLSDNDIVLDLPEGEYELYLGMLGDDSPSDNPPSTLRQIDAFRYFIEIRNQFGETMYDVVMQLRDLVSKYGGIESKKYFNETRLFALNETDAEFLRTVEAPQIYIPSATLRQTLIFILSYVNALPRLVRGFGIDMLSLEHFGKSLGTFIKENITESYSEQNTNQIGTRSYAELHNILPNNLNEATTYSPYQNGFQTVRATNVQLTDTSFVLKLPSDKPLYKPKSIKTRIDLTLRGYSQTTMQYEHLLNSSFMLDLTDLYINQSEWQLKEVTSDFPDVFYTSMNRDKIHQIGLDMYKTENIAWSEGDTVIRLSDVYGTIFRSNLLESVLKHQINKHILEQGLGGFEDIMLYQVDIPNINEGALWFKDLLFNVEYITNENMAIKQDKEDLSQISFYSEIRHNQDENTISLARSSSKIYGDLQRTGNKVSTFTKRHTSFSDMYEIGQKDKDNYTITSIQSQYFVDFIETTYTVIKYHNRISQATFIDQTYRWRDNYASELKQRNETYNDYILLLPHKPSEQPLFENTDTKIVSKKYSGQGDEVAYFYKVLFGNLGVEHPIDETKATTALVRTDGTVAEANDGAGYFHFISTPITSAGFKGGLVFKIGFNDNQVAGDGLIQKDGNWYNQAVRYTDRNARIKYFDFYILNKRSFRNADGNETSRYPAIIEYSSVVDNTTPATNNDLVYFSTGNVVENETANDSLIVNKDPMSNFNLNYALNVMSYYYGLFILGRDFFTKNQMISNNKNNENFVPYLYIYNNDTSYDIFEDIKVKGGYRVSYNLRTDTTRVFLTMSGEYVIINVGGLLPFDTSWAIGDGDGNLIFASNENISQIEIVRSHIRPNVNVVGEINSGLKQTALLDVVGGLINSVVGGFNLRANVNASVDYIQDSVPSVEAILNVFGGLANEVVGNYSLNGNVGINTRYFNGDYIDVFADLNVKGGLSNEQVDYFELNANTTLESEFNGNKPEIRSFSANTLIQVKGGLINGSAGSVMLRGAVGLDETIVQEKDRTLTPSVGTLRCLYDIDFTRNIYATITNNESVPVTIRNYGSTVGSLLANETKLIEIDHITSTPQTVYYQISAKRTDKDVSLNNVGSGKIIVCNTE